ncbi:MAG: hypothetical protein DMD81_00335 [Candidatus Rokuibacteriota bacterium]|nr:MAG: hypothetical protein DMD81_00335 [Candidatus Rokubacteria bacterium]
MFRSLMTALGVFALVVAAGSVTAQQSNPANSPQPSAPTSTGCASVPAWNQLRTQLNAANNAVHLTLNNDMWATIVAADGTVCAVVQSGNDNLQSQWLLSRAISAQKANTANGLSLQAGQGQKSDLKGLALSTANLWKAVQPGGSLYGLQHSNPVDPAAAYAGSSQAFGTSTDPMVGHRIGGVNVFGGGLALYDQNGTRVGGVGVSGDTSCRDHMVAWELRHNLNLDFVPAGVSGDNARPDNIIFDTNNGFGHPNCLDPAAEKAAAGALSPTRH